MMRCTRSGGLTSEAALGAILPRLTAPSDALSERQYEPTRMASDARTADVTHSKKEGRPSGPHSGPNRTRHDEPR